jgi:hypothetical protein
MLFFSHRTSIRPVHETSESSCFLSLPMDCRLNASRLFAKRTPRIVRPVSFFYLVFCSQIPFLGSRMAMPAILILVHPSTSSYNTFYISKRRTSPVKCRWRVADHDDGKHTKSIHHIQGGMGAICADFRYPFPLILLFTGLLCRIVL